MELETESIPPLFDPYELTLMQNFTFLLSIYQLNSLYYLITVVARCPSEDTSNAFPGPCLSAQCHMHVLFERRIASLFIM